MDPSSILPFITINSFNVPYERRSRLRVEFGNGMGRKRFEAALPPLDMLRNDAEVCQVIAHCFRSIANDIEHGDERERERVWQERLTRAHDETRQVRDQLAEANMRLKAVEGISNGSLPMVPTC